jgi:sarcosine oxidase subunit gamma
VSTEQLVPNSSLGSRCNTGIALRDGSDLPRAGFKGPAAADFLRTNGVPVPERHNQWSPHLGGFVMRLGYSEFLLESPVENDWITPLDERSRAASQVVPVLRQDTSLLLSGPRVHDLLAQVCSFDFESLRTSPNEVIMTQMVGVSIIALCTSPSSALAYRVWCDPSFGDYLIHTLEQIITEQAP